MARRLSRRRWLGGAAAAWLVWPAGLRAQEGVFGTPESAPRALFRDLVAAHERRIAATPELRARVRELLGRAPSSWEEAYQVFSVDGPSGLLGHVVIVEEIGKHRPITFAIAVRPNGSIHDMLVLAYREAYGGEVRERRFLRQYAGKGLRDPLLPYRDVVNISGATMSVTATGRAARKAIAVLTAAGILR